MAGVCANPDLSSTEKRAVVQHLDNGNFSWAAGAAQLYLQSRGSGGNTSRRACVRLKCCSFQELNQSRSSFPEVNLTRPKGRLNVSIQIFPSWSACLVQGASGIMRRFSRQGRKSPAGKHSNDPQSSATNRTPNPPTKSFPSGNKRLHEPDSSIVE